MVDYRGATVEDLDLLPALTVLPDTPLSRALELSYERSFSYLPVVSKSKKLLGYLTAEQLQRSGATLDEKEPVKGHFTRFDTKARYRIITPDTPLEVLEEFFKDQDFAVVTDDSGKLVYGVATREDLEEFTKHRPQIH